MHAFCDVAKLLHKSGALGMSAWRFMATVTVLREARFKFVQLNCTDDLEMYFMHAKSSTDNPINEATLRYALLTLTIMSEYPAARSKLKPLLSRIEPTEKFSNKAVTQLAWEP